MRLKCLVLASFAINACGSDASFLERSAPCNGISLDILEQSAAPPANVSALVRITDCRGRALPNRLDSAAFELREDGVLLSTYEASREIFPAHRQRAQRTLIALDLSGSIVRSGLRPAMIAGARALIAGLDDTHEVAIFGFDGRPDLTPFAFFTADRVALSIALDMVEAALLVDDSTNLNGAVVASLRLLDRAVETEMRESDIVAHGSLVVFTDGHDLARRVPEDVLDEALDDTDHSTFAIGVGSSIDREALSEIGRTYTAIAGPEEVVAAFEEVGEKLRERAESDYVVSYCSPARAGRRTLEIRVIQGTESGEAELPFDADGFGPGCTPTSTPLN